jgi:hypothetical protein
MILSRARYLGDLIDGFWIWWSNLLDHYIIALQVKIGIVAGGVQLGPLGTAATNRPIVPAPGDYHDGEIGGIKIGRGNPSTRRKPASVPFCPPQTPHAARMLTQAAAVGSQRLIASATARPTSQVTLTYSSGWSLHWNYSHFQLNWTLGSTGLACDSLRLLIVSIRVTLRLAVYREIS